MQYNAYFDRGNYMFLKTLKSAAIIFSLTASTNLLAKVDALMSPQQGKQAFELIYKEVRKARDYVHISIYSWSDAGIDKALIAAEKAGADVRVVLHPNLYKDKESVQDKVATLEKAGIEVKIAAKKMHEKMVIVDNRFLVNTSANFSSGPKSRYSENWVFHYKDGSKEISDILEDFNNEFTILWNSGYDVITNRESNADSIDFYSKAENLPSKYSAAPLYSSSMNHTIKKNKPTSSAYKTGRYISLSRRGGTRNQSWLIRDRVISEIDKSESSVLCSFNHLNIKEVKDALVRASKRGVDVKLTVDNQEFKTSLSTKENTPNFVSEWSKLPGNKDKEAPVRVKYYSHAPSPRHWLLNHHKFCLVDYKTNKTVLINGSYNFSKTAEHNQFDNQVFYTGDAFDVLYKKFYVEFENQWSWGRTSNDRPNLKTLDQFLSKTRDGGYPLHLKAAVALSWNEIIKLRKEVRKIAPGIFKVNYKTSDCLYYNPAGSGRFYGCPK
jgi:phosphatidylserine/phosphatidylglycerophosphate/cardiolipin synthase-like enzyme